MRSVSPRAIALACLLFTWAIYSLAAAPLREAVTDYQSGNSASLRYADTD